MREIIIPDLLDLHICEMLSIDIEVDIYLQHIKIFIDESTNRVYIIDRKNQTFHLGKCEFSDDQNIKKFVLSKIKSN